MAAPGTVALLIPWWISGWRLGPPLLGLPFLRMAGAVWIAVALPVLLDSFARFALEGWGTPAPVLPTRSLVVTGWYGYVRNPMYVAVVGAILGQGLLFGSAPTLLYGACVWLGFHAFVCWYEEPTLRRTYGQDYHRFCQAVPRWIPRLRPWRPQRAGACPGRTGRRPRPARPA